MYGPLLRTVLIAIGAFILIIATFHAFSKVPTGSSDSLLSHLPSISITPSKWEYDSVRDAEDYSLTQDQCQSAFPNAYYEIDRAVAYWRQNGTIEPSQIDINWRGDGAIRAMIHDRQLYILQSKGATQFHGWRERSLAVLHQINRAILSSRDPVPNIEFSFVVNDRVDPPKNTNHTHWGFSRKLSAPNYDRLWLIPDFNYWTFAGVAGSFADYQRKVRDHDRPMVEKRPELVWRGAVDVNPGLRGRLLKATKGKSWSDVMSFNWGNKTDVRVKKLPMPSHCRYQFTAHTEVTVVHELEWIANYYHLLVAEGPDQNILGVKRDWSDLEEKLDYYLEHTEEAQRIADNGVATFRDRYLTPAAEACYWRRLFDGWAEVSFTPEAYETVTNEDGVEESKWRGMSFEEFV
ncbi:hypothetical protein M8818_003598 [Zalaria obscura]|uniref:Uncharacterized protein n=1 Tax=Zalaria obscura TaxID=2024903 RepID=A0ACC3SDS2_9PEZI